MNQRLVIYLVAALCGILTAAHTARATVRTVTNLNDDGSSGTLRSQIDAAVNGDTVNFASSLSGTIDLTNGQLAISNNITINGPGANILTVKSDPVYNQQRIFRVLTNETVTISGLTVTEGSQDGYSGNDTSWGGGALNYGVLTLSNCWFVNNSASIGSSADNGYSYGGAVCNLGTLTVIGCTFSSNTVSGFFGFDLNNVNTTGGTAAGGAIYSSGTLFMTNSTVMGCHVTGGFSEGSAGLGPFSGGLALGGGLCVLGNATVVGCTIVSNVATGGATSGSGGVSGGDVYGGGIEAVLGNLYLDSSIVAENNGVGGVAGAGGTNGAATGPDIAGYVYSQGYNLIGLNNGSSGWLATDLTGVIGTIYLPLNPQIGPLRNNGGPTPTMALLTNSPAIDAGDDSLANFLAYDQRGVGHPRKYGAHVDIGACESSPGPLITHLTDTELRDVIYTAAPGSLIAFNSGLSGTVQLTAGELLISNSVSIIGPTNASIVFNGASGGRVFHFTGGTNTLSNLTISGGNTPSGVSGGGIYIEPPATLILDGCTVSGNSSTNSSDVGGIDCYGNLLATNCTISGNNGASTGGLFIDSTNSVLCNCTICSNFGSEYGGISSYNPLGGKPTVINCIIAGNSGGTAPDVQGAFASLGYNLIGQVNSAETGFGASHDLLGTSAAPLKPLLGPLQNNGGPAFTHGLFWGSPAIDAGYSVGATTDQRGLPRPYDFSGIANAGDGSDIGAFELQSVPAPPPFSPVLRQSGHLIITWASGGIYTLQQNTNLSSGSGWQNSGYSITTNNGANSITVPSPTGNLFFRLHP